MSTAVDTPQTTAPPAAEEGFKVFAGNLAFATTEEELNTVFSEAGTVSSAQIITRGTRSLGYGFVTYASEADAQKAIETLNGKEISGRQISVESAKPQTVTEGGEAKAGKTKTRTRTPKARTGAAAARRPRTDEGEEGGAEASAEAPKANGKGTSKSARRRQKKKAAAAAANGDAPATLAAPKPKREKPAGEPSKTLVFVANLSFETTDEKLKESFSDFQLTSAHVVKRRVGNRSKGFGFVDFANEQEQKKAIESAQNREIDGRQVSLKVAIQEEKKEVEKADE